MPPPCNEPDLDANENPIFPRFEVDTIVKRTPGRDDQPKLTIVRADNPYGDWYYVLSDGTEACASDLILQTDVRRAGGGVKRRSKKRSSKRRSKRSYKRRSKISSKRRSKKRRSKRR